MADIASNLQYLKESKDLLMQSIIDRGGEVTGADPLRSYVEKIEELPGTSSTDIASNIDNISRIMYWSDATINTRSGYGASTPYVHTIVAGANPLKTGELTVYNTTYNNKTSGSWDGKFLNLGSNGAFKVQYPMWADPLTVELVYRFTESPSGNDTQRLIQTGSHWWVTAVGHSHESTEFRGRLGIGSSGTNGMILDLVELGVPYYIVIRFSSENGTEVLVEPNGSRYKDPSFKLATPTANSYTGFGASGGTGSAFSGVYTKGMQFGMVRCWNKWLSEEEIVTNYADIRKRFEF